jgi:hypothetical protein
MISKHRSAPVGLLLTALVAAALFLSPSSAQSSATHAGAGNLVGEWRMTSLEVGGEPVPYSGQVIFTKAGTMSVQAMNPDADAPDTAYTVDGYEAYYGPVEVDRRAGSFALTVESAAARALIGQTLTREYDVSGDTLVLTPSDPSEGWQVTYTRMR